MMINSPPRKYFTNVKKTKVPDIWGHMEKSSLRVNQNLLTLRNQNQDYNQIEDQSYLVKLIRQNTKVQLYLKIKCIMLLYSITVQGELISFVVLFEIKQITSRKQLFVNSIAYTQWDKLSQNLKCIIHNLDISKTSLSKEQKHT